jgi:hypothetical protein
MWQVDRVKGTEKSNCPEYEDKKAGEIYVQKLA